MSYNTPHGVRDYLAAACLRINHDYVMRCQRRAVKDKKALLIKTREIDLCAKIADYFGPSAHLAAQGIGTSKGRDLEIDGPTIRAEVKYFRPLARAWDSLQFDWDWLLSLSNTNQEFSKRAWIVFWPSAANDMFSFTNCLSVGKSHGTAYASADFAPFMPYAKVEMPTKGTNQRLVFRHDAPRSSLIKVPNGKRVRCDLIGSLTHAIWAAIYTRITPEEADEFPPVASFAPNSNPIPNP